MFFFYRKKSYLSSGLLSDITDIHSHILPEVDDGIRSYERAVEALRWLKDKGVGRIYLTPHVMSDFSENTRANLMSQFDLFMQRLDADGIKNIPDLKLGAEYMLEPAFESHKSDGLLTYADRHVLVETSYITPPFGFSGILEALKDDGYTPVLAHPERYLYMDINDYKSLKSKGISFQFNFLSLMGAYGRNAKEKATWLLNERLYDYAGSDFHRLARHENHFSLKLLTKKQLFFIQTLFYNNQKLW